LIKEIIHYLANINFHISPLNNVHKSGPNSWHATTDDPQLLLKSPFFFKGWYFIELKVEHHSAVTQTAKLYPNYGEGYKEETAFAIPLRYHKPTYKVIFLNKKVKKIRFDPVETNDNFTLKHFKIYRIPQTKAKRVIFRRIAHLHPSLNNKTAKELENILINQSKQNQQDWRQNILTTYKETFSKSSRQDNYQLWIKNTEQKQSQEIKTITENLQIKPLISILLPTYNSNIEYLKQCIESVQNQSYTNWQLCIADDASTYTDHLKHIHQASKQDSRINFQQRKTNGHISDATNTCLSMATGDYTLLLDHDDTLPEHSLLHLVNAIQNNKHLQLIYADEDKIDDKGNRFEPHFKPEWNPDLLYSQNYIGHPVLLNTQTVKQLGGFRQGVEGSQDHDLLLRYTANLATSQIHRIPVILYHWRLHSESTAADANAKNYTTQAGIKALQDHFSNQNISVKIGPGKLPNTYRVQWPIPKQQPLVSLIIPTHNGYEILKTCITSILEKTTYQNYEILIINNQVDCHQTLNFIDTIEQKNHNIQVLKWNHPFNYSAINNYGASQANGSILGLINNDIEVITPDWLTEMVSHALRPEIGCVGSKLYYPNNKIQHAGVILGIGGVAGHAHKYFNKEQSGYFSRLKLTQNFSAVTAACLIVRKKVFEQVNGLDQNNLPIAFNDVDFCLRIRNAGYRNIWTPYAELYHHESISRGEENTPEKQNRAMAEIQYTKYKWGSSLIKDPAYNPNLTLHYEDFSLKN